MSFFQKVWIRFFICDGSRVNKLITVKATNHDIVSKESQSELEESIVARSDRILGIDTVPENVGKLSVVRD